MKCTYCGNPTDRPCVDEYHRAAPLCPDCFHNPQIAKLTASNPDDPASWWNKPTGIKGPLN
jgi:hypothetical protein